VECRWKCGVRGIKPRFSPRRMYLALLTSPHALDYLTKKVICPALKTKSKSNCISIVARPQVTTTPLRHNGVGSDGLAARQPRKHCQLHKRGTMQPMQCLFRASICGDSTEMTSTWWSSLLCNNAVR
jgi:hypothetical protein